VAPRTRAGGGRRRRRADVRAAVRRAVHGTGRRHARRDDVAHRLLFAVAGRARSVRGRLGKGERAQGGRDRARRRRRRDHPRRPRRASAEPRRAAVDPAGTGRTDRRHGDAVAAAARLRPGGRRLGGGRRRVRRARRVGPAAGPRRDPVHAARNVELRVAGAGRRRRGAAAAVRVDPPARRDPCLQLPVRRPGGHGDRRLARARYAVAADGRRRAGRGRGRVVARQPVPGRASGRISRGGPDARGPRTGSTARPSCGCARRRGSRSGRGW